MATTQASAKMNQPDSVWQNWRHLIIAGGFLVWIGSMALRTGAGAFVALWNVLLFLGALVIVTTPTRTVTARELLAPFSLGGAMVGLSVLAGWVFSSVLGTRASATRALGMPLVEEVLKISPVLWILWRHRKKRAWTFGATDVMLLAATSGAAFYWVEESFIIHNQRSWSFVGRFPTTDLTINFVANHAIWTAIAGLTIGIALLLRGPRGRMLLVAVSGCLWSTLDHAANNYHAHFRNALTNVLGTVTGNGYFSLYIFLLGVCFAFVLDLYFAYLAAGKRSRARLPPFPATWNQAKAALRFLRMRRQLAYAAARYRKTSGRAQARLGLLGLALGTALRTSLRRRPASGPKAA